MKWILIMYISFGGGHQGGPVSAEFDTESACFVAAQTIVNDFDGRSGQTFIRSTCVPKGDQD